MATICSVIPPGRYGAIASKGEVVSGFTEKPAGDGGRINGGFFILSPKVLNYIDNEQTSWEGEPLTRLAQENELTAYTHDGFWQPMDTIREKSLEELWSTGRAPWKVW